MARNKDKSKSPIYEKVVCKPSEYMRSRRPELFSDTCSSDEQILEENFLEYHLETLTNRKQEQIFEEFCRRMVTLEICPNIKPQTGPTGGGDSKVDASTYPVSSILALRCYWGNPKPSDEVWAFAFSCKKKWKGKVDEDIAKIADLKKNFSKVFFISNQFIRDKGRAETEEKLSKKYGFDVHILDRTWIVKTVKEHKREDVAIDALGIRTGKKEKPQIGPKDLSRKAQLDNLLEQLGKPEMYYGNDYALALDYLNAAVLARGLEKPHHEIDGLFVRARTLAENCGNTGQIIRCGYHHAWTCFWWYDDYIQFEQIYSQIEKYLVGTEDAEDCELFSNLWTLLYGMVKKGEITKEKAKLEERLTNINRELERLGSEKQRHNNALQAKTQFYLNELTIGIQDKLRAKNALEGIRKCLKISIGLGNYPTMHFITTLTDLVDLLGNLEGYNLLFDEIRDIVRSRRGETEEGRLLYKRGMNLIGTGKPQDTIRYLGQAWIKLHKEETLQESVQAHLGCCDAYRCMGLYWAARLEALTAAQISLQRKGTPFLFPVEAILASIRMGWLELQLGRISPFLSWYQLSWLLFEHLLSMQFSMEEIEEDLRLQDAVLGCLLLNQNKDYVKGLVGLENKMDELNLIMTKSALLYCLDKKDIIMKEAPDVFLGNMEELEKFYTEWKVQPASKQIPLKNNKEGDEYYEYETKLMDVQYTLKTRNQFNTIVFSENLLGMIEAALALARWENLAFIVDDVKFLIDVDQYGQNPPTFDFTIPPDPNGYRFIWKHNMLEWLNKTEYGQIVDYFKQFLLKLLMDITIDPYEDLKEEFDRWNREAGFSRSLGMSLTSRALRDIIGEERYDIKYWTNTTVA